MSDRVPHIRMDDYKLPTGGYDWSAYYSAKRKNGELCSVCGRIIVFAAGAPAECFDCRAMAKDEEVSHEHMLRCPRCRRAWAVDGEDSVWGDGEHDVSCSECGQEFTVSTQVSYLFTSPAVLGTQP